MSFAVPFLAAREAHFGRAQPALKKLCSDLRLHFDILWSNSVNRRLRYL